MAVPDTKYAKCGDLNIAYQVMGQGPDLIYAWGFLSHLDFQWAEPVLATFLRQLAGFSRLIMFDRRGTGLSDPVRAAPTFDERMDDMLAVMDAVGSERAALLGFSEGTALSALFGATHPDRTTALILYDGYAVGPDVQGPYFDPFFAEQSHEIRRAMDRWGEGETMKWIAPSLGDSAVQRRMWGAFERASVGPGMARSLWETCRQVDVTSILPSIQLPTLVLHHKDSFIPNACGRLMAELIPGARYVELPGRDHLPGAGDPAAIAGEIEEFLTGARSVGRPDRILATVLFTDIVDSTQRATDLGDRSWLQLLERHDAMLRARIERFGGVEVKQTGDGFVARFDGPARAIRCACAIREEAESLGLAIRAGLHTGECEVVGSDLAGVAVHVAARVAAAARPGEVLVSGTLRDLVMGSDIALTDRGAQQLKGVPGEWRLFAVDGEGDAIPPAVGGGSMTPDPVGITDRAARRLARSAPGLARTSARFLRRRTPI